MIFFLNDFFLPICTCMYEGNYFGKFLKTL